MIKLFLISVIITGFSFVGISLSKNEKSELKKIYALIAFLSHAEREITLNRSSFDSIVSSFENSEKEAKVFFDILGDEKSDKTPREKISDAVSSLCLKDGINDTLYDLASSFGRYDAETQAKKLRQAIDRLSSEYERQSKEINAKSKLYRSVSAFLGIAAAIILY